MNVRGLGVTITGDPTRAGEAVARLSRSMGYMDNKITLLMEDHMDRVRRPWRYPDRNPFPKLDWWPWIDRWRAAPAEYRSRALCALDVLRNGVPDDDGDDW